MDFSALAAVAVTAAAKPASWKEGSNPEATTIPTITGTKALYVLALSFLPTSRKPRTAVKAGVVAPIACTNTADHHCATDACNVYCIRA